VIHKPTERVQGSADGDKQGDNISTKEEFKNYHSYIIIIDTNRIEEYNI